MVASESVDARLELAYEESVRAWALQSAVLDELRSRAGLLIAAASVSSAFLGAHDLGVRHSLHPLDVAAIALFGLVTLLCVYVLWPAKGWVFAHNAENVIKTYVKNGGSVNAMYRQMTIDNTAYRQGNHQRINLRFFAFRLACLSLGGDIVLWLLALHR